MQVVTIKTKFRGVLTDSRIKFQMKNESSLFICRKIFPELLFNQLTWTQPCTQGTAGIKGTWLKCKVWWKFERSEYKIYQGITQKVKRKGNNRKYLFW